MGYIYIYVFNKLITSGRASRVGDEGQFRSQKRP